MVCPSFGFGRRDLYSFVPALLLSILTPHFLHFRLFFHVWFSHARVFGITLLHVFFMSYCHAEWYFLFSDKQLPLLFFKTISWLYPLCIPIRSSIKTISWLYGLYIPIGCSCKTISWLFDHDSACTSLLAVPRWNRFCDPMKKKNFVWRRREEAGC